MLLQQARDEIELLNKQHEVEVRTLQDQLHAKSKDALKSFKAAINESLNSNTNTNNPLTNEQVLVYLNT